MADDASGTLAPQVIRDVLQRQMAAVRACYERELRTDTTLEGRLTVHFRIAPDGAVTEAEVAGSTLGNPAVESCVLDRVRETVFPAPEGGSVTVSYPFTFRPSS